LFFRAGFGPPVSAIVDHPDKRWISAQVSLSTPIRLLITLILFVRFLDLNLRVPENQHLHFPGLWRSLQSYFTLLAIGLGSLGPLAGDLILDLAAHLWRFIRPCLSTNLASDLHTKLSELLQAADLGRLALGRIIAIAVAFVLTVATVGNALEFWETFCERLLDEVLQLVLVKAMIDLFLLMPTLALPGVEKTQGGCGDTARFGDFCCARNLLAIVTNPVLQFLGGKGVLVSDPTSVTRH